MNAPATPYAIAAIASFLYGLVAIAGGIMGFVNKGSKPSLFAGGLSGLLLLASSIGMWQENWWAALSGLVLSFLLVGRFASTLARQRRLQGAMLASVLGKVSLVMMLGGLVVLVLSALALAR